MTLAIFLLVIAGITILQTAIPFLLKNTVVFGVSIPDGHSDDPQLHSFKKKYSITTFSIGLLALFVFYFWTKHSGSPKENIVLAGTAIQFAIIIISMVLYFYFHAKTANLKRKNRWGAGLKQVKVSDLTIRSKDEMLPSYMFIIPMMITVGFIAYTAAQYDSLPDQIPTHWGADGKPDAFSEKGPFSILSLPLILLTIQAMFLGINVMTKRSGIKLSATKSNTSRIRQLGFRKYTSWLLLIMSVLMTLLLGYLQLSILHQGLGGEIFMTGLPIIFLLLVLIMTGMYAFKVGQGGSRLEVDMTDLPAEGIMDVDDDQYWKGGIFYVNKDDPSIFVEKRFGVGWTINLAHPLSYLMILGPILLILIITYFS
jgi:uncharacterized membrane protein